MCNVWNLQGLDGVSCYNDNILVTTKTDDKHVAHLEEVLRHLHKHGVRVKRAKCQFLKLSFIFLGYHIDALGIHYTADNLKAIVEAPAPKNVQVLRSFFRFVKYYSKFIQSASTLLPPLNRSQVDMDTQVSL